ncbi:putative addiction module antidote protein [Rhizobium sp. SG_E_25_P2]|jgi:probable addiction module antidote protein|uniref:addiction module antidote protein n=1 Tax=Rhizobium sp. SG_E_25_P2 TaxID=2879942 RepID=UPI002473C383|nr:addiction module antidote protein [Rhizobium sp. SG_E_25_P2]MDH6267339.1 putative addiction module antidote protein [Rhizobium sp. SG_E_25_P2]
MTSIKDLPRFDAADYLGSAEARADYLALALEEGDAAEIRRALNTVARSLGMAAVAEEAGLGRESLTKALGDNGNSEFSTILKLMKAMGLKLSALPIKGADGEEG